MLALAAAWMADCKQTRQNRWLIFNLPCQDSCHSQSGDFQAAWHSWKAKSSQFSLLWYKRPAQT